MSVMGSLCTPPRTGSSCWPRGERIQDGGAKRTTLHPYTAISSLRCPTGAHLPLPGENVPYCQKLTASHITCRQTGIGQIFSLERGGHSKPLVELFSWCVWVDEKSRRAGRGLQGGSVFSQSRQGTGTILLPSVLPFAAAQSMWWASSNCNAIPLCVLP